MDSDDQQQQEMDNDNDSQNGGNLDDQSGLGSDNSAREKERDRRGRGSRFSDGNSGGVGGGHPRDRSRGRCCRIYVSNIPYDYRWQDLKDLFRRIVGNVEYVEIFNDEQGKPRGCAIIDFKEPEMVQAAVEKMNRHEINGREIVVKEDHGDERDQYGRVIRDRDRFPRRNAGGGGGNNDRNDDRLSRYMNSGGSGGGMGMMPNDYDGVYNTYGLNTSFLESLGITGPLHNKVFVANLDYKVDSKKLKQVFKLAGYIESVDLSVDKDGNSRGFAVIEYNHPVEAVQAISLFDRQVLYDRRMTVRLDRIPVKGEMLKLPDGLVSIGTGLGPNGEPFRDVARNLPQMMQNQSSYGTGMGMNMGNSMPVPVAPPMNGASSSDILGAVANAANTNVLNNLSSTNLAALSNVVGGFKNIPGVGAALSNNSLLSNLGLNLGNNSNTVVGSDGGSKTGVTDTQQNISASQTPQMGNSYSTGGSGYGSIAYTTSDFSSVPRTDYDNPVRNYNTQQQEGNNYQSSQMFGNTPGSTGRKSDTIVIKNIPLSCTWQTLRDKFRDIGEVKFAEIRGNDVGVVRFFKESDAELAIKLMDGSRMDGRVVTVNFF